MNDTEPSGCSHCGAALHGRFCAQCGTEQSEVAVQSIRALVLEGFRSAFDLDSALWRSLRILCFQPGALTRRFMAGRSHGQLSPARLFLFANLVYFVVQPWSGFDGFNTSLNSHLDRQPYSAVMNLRARVVADVDARVAGTVPAEAGGDIESDQLWRLTSAAYLAEFDARGEVISRSAVGLMIPAIALALGLLFVRSGVPAVQHLVFATHHFAWYLLVVMSVFLPLLSLVSRGGFQLADIAFGLSRPEVLALPVVGLAVGALLEGGSALVQAPWAWLGLRRAYGLGAVAAGWRALVLVGATVLATTAFRLIVFGLTWLAMR